ncbi:FAD-binding protein [Pseudaestuariivita sp.]|uniref:FAD-binding protein n=1 Tax=Pseudaestuariivita sp. TaxID=2211669 RepID=UPI00405900A5
MRPESESELSEMLRAARGPLRIVGGGTRSIGCVDGDVLETGGLSGVTLYEPGALTLVAGAGTPLEEIEAVVAAEGQGLAFEPRDLRAVLRSEGVSTIGGVFAANASGPRRVVAGAARDFALGVRFVDGSGEIIKNGGRVMKNVTGYDLVKLLCGSWGTLGVLTEVSLKVLPAPKTRAGVLINGLDVAEAVPVMSAGLGSPYEVTGAAHAPVGAGGAPVTMLRVEGFEAQVAYRAAEVARLIGRGAVIEDDPAKIAADWRWVRDAKAVAGAEGDLWRISVRPSDAPSVVAALDAKAMLLDWGGGLIWARVAAGHDVRAALSVPGHATCLRGAAAAFHPAKFGVGRLEAGLRDKFDPRGVLNPGLMA